MLLLIWYLKLECLNSNAGSYETLEKPLDCKDIKPINPKGNQSWIFIGRTDAGAEVPVLWPPDAKSWLIGKDPEAGKKNKTMERVKRLILLEPTQTHVHWFSDAIQPSHLLSSPSPPALSLSQIRVFSNESALCIRWPKYWSLSFSISPSNEYSGLISFRISFYNWLIWSLCSPRDSQ